MSVGIVVRPAQYYVSANEGVRAFRSANIGVGYVRDDDWIFISREGHKRNPKSELKAGDVLIVRSGNAGIACVVPGKYAGVNCIDIVFARPKKKVIVPEYLCAFTNSELGRKQILRVQGGLALTHLNVGAYETISLPVPPYWEQERIVSYLDGWNRSVRFTERLVQGQISIKYGLMHLLLTGKLRYKEFTNNEVLKYHLGDLFEERREASRDDLPLLSISATRGVIPQGDLSKKDTSSDDKSKYKRIAPGDIGYNTMRMWQGVSALSTIEGIVSPAYTICIPGSKVDGRFAKHLFKYQPMVRSFWRYSQGLVDDTLSLKYHNFAQIKIKLPPVAEQRRIAKLLDAIDREIDFLNRQANALSRQKKALLQKLLTGQIRVKV